jgi:hypothetical protein
LFSEPAVEPTPFPESPSSSGTDSGSGM